MRSIDGTATAVALAFVLALAPAGPAPGHSPDGGSAAETARPPAQESAPGGALDLGRLRGLHYDGLGAPRDDADAARLYRIAALQGHAEDLRLRLEREMTPGQRDEARRLAGEAADR